MLRLFRTNQISASLLLVFYALLLRASVFIIPYEKLQTSTGIFSDWVYSIVGTSGWVSETLALLLVFIQAVAINAIINDHKLNATVNMFPGVFYILLCSTFPETLHLSPLILANTFLLIALAALLNTYKSINRVDRIYNIGFWIGISSLFYPPYIWFILAAFSGLSILRAFRFQERLMVITGALTPFVLVFVYYFWLDQPYLVLLKQFVEPFDFLNFPLSAFSVKAAVMLAGTGILLLILLLGQSSFLFRKTIDVRKKINILYWMLFSGGMTILFLHNWTLDHLLILSIPSGVLLSFAFTQLSNKWAEAIHFLLILGILLLHYQSILIQ